MHALSTALVGFAMPFFVSLVLTSVMRRVALKFNIVDRPNSEVKTHRKPTPYLGGLAICTAVALVLLRASWMEGMQDKRLAIIAAGAVLTTLLGLWDDLQPFSPLAKLAGQAAIAALTVNWGLVVAFTGIPGLDTLLTMVWIMTLMNAFNLIDIMDGLAGGIAAIGAAALAFLMMRYGHPGSTLLFLATAAASLAFLVYNFHPAKIFMGDAGSMTLGYLFSAGLVVGPWEHAEPWSMPFLLVLFALAIPLFELVFLSVIRPMKGRSPLQGSKDHFALRLLRLGLSVRQTVLLSYLLAGVFAFGALWGASNSIIAPWLLAGGVSALLFLGVMLGRVSLDEKKG